MAFVPRLSTLTPTDMTNNPWWYSSGNKYYASGYGLPNCTCYCYGRVGEYLGAFDTRVPNGDGGQWYPNAVAAGELPVGGEPALGAIACWYDPGGYYAGHVAIVEDIQDNGNTLILSNSGWVRPIPPSDPFNFWTATVTRDYNYTETWARARGYVLQGFIYTYQEPTPPPPPPPTRRNGLPIWMLLRYGL